MTDMQAMANALIKGDRNTVIDLCRAAVKEGMPPEEILNQGLIAGMNVIGRRFKANEVYVPEVLIAARAMKGAMEVLKPCLAAAGIQPRGVVVIGTVKGDLHDIGKNLVGMMLEGAGFKVVDAGINVEPAKFIQLAKENNANVIGTSALLTTTMTNMKTVVDSVKSSGLSGKVKVMIGGAPVTQAYADEIGADGYAADAASAVLAVRDLVGVA